MEIYQPAEDSYLISEAIEKTIKEFSPATFLEIGIGSGINLQTAEKSGIPKTQIAGVDINFEAVKHCEELGFQCMISNLFQNIDPEFRYDLIVFNPPYLPKIKHDKEADTTGGETGSEVIIEFLIQAKKRLEENGKILLLTSSLTPEIEFNEYGYKSKKVTEKDLFFEKLFVWELSL